MDIDELARIISSLTACEREQLARTLQRGPCVDQAESIVQVTRVRAEVRGDGWRDQWCPTAARVGDGQIRIRSYENGAGYKRCQVVCSYIQDGRCMAVRIGGAHKDCDFTADHSIPF